MNCTRQRCQLAPDSTFTIALAGAVPLSIDPDVVLSVLAHTVCAALRRRLPSYATTTPTSCNDASYKPEARS